MSPSSQLFALEEELDYSEQDDFNLMEYGDTSPSLAGLPFPPMPSDIAASGSDGNNGNDESSGCPQVPSTPKGSSSMPPLTPKSSGGASMLPPLLSPPMPLPTDNMEEGGGVEKLQVVDGGPSLSRRRLPPGLNQNLLNVDSAPSPAAVTLGNSEDRRAFQTLPSVVSWVGIMTANPSGATSSSTPSDAEGGDSGGDATPSGVTPSRGRRRNRRLSTSAPPLDHKSAFLTPTI
jgi:hypothetical protein